MPIKYAIERDRSFGARRGPAIWPQDASFSVNAEPHARLK